MIGIFLVQTAGELIMANPASTVPEYWDRYAGGVNADTALDGGLRVDAVGRPWART